MDSGNQGVSDIPVAPVLIHYGWNIPDEIRTWRTVRCGVHEDTHGSCRVTDTYVYCQACGFKGDAVDIVKHYEGLGFSDAVNRAAELAGVSDSTVRGGTGGRYGSSDLPRGSRAHRRSRPWSPNRLRTRGVSDV